MPVVVRLRCSLWTVLRRNRGRHRRVPVLVLVRMWWVVRALSPDRLRDEGFADVQDLRTDKSDQGSPQSAGSVES
ncbi:hypothetical protein ACFXGA_27070 [Actinosynnema sp. NPDC059335]|uniref:hypothetical protein n=1 Tax=Actinosynnema sp. NPDC059335 TaxID=3346804 RepID=UPI00366F5A90